MWRPYEGVGCCIARKDLCNAATALGYGNDMSKLLCHLVIPDHIGSLLDDDITLIAVQQTPTTDAAGRDGLRPQVLS
jgi:hypothetical protein